MTNGTVRVVISVERTSRAVECVSPPCALPFDDANPAALHLPGVQLERVSTFAQCCHFTLYTYAQRIIVCGICMCA
jgi:hypothetical protein